MAKPVEIFILASLLIAACSDNPASPATGQIQSADLIGDWSGQLPLLSMWPNSSFPVLPRYESNPLYNRRFDFRNLDVYVHVSDTEFLILLKYRSDSLDFLYEERGNWEFSGAEPRYLKMDSTRVSGWLDNWQSRVYWDTSGCCWQAGLDLENVDPASAGFGAQILRIFDIQSRLAIGDLQLHKELRLQLP